MPTLFGQAPNDSDVIDQWIDEQQVPEQPPPPSPMDALQKAQGIRPVEGIKPAGPDTFWRFGMMPDAPAGSMKTLLETIYNGLAGPSKVGSLRSGPAVDKLMQMLHDFTAPSSDVAATMDPQEIFKQFGGVGAGKYIPPSVQAPELQATKAAQRPFYNPIRKAQGEGVPQVDRVTKVMMNKVEPPRVSTRDVGDIADLKSGTAVPVEGKVKDVKMLTSAEMRARKNMEANKAKLEKMQQAAPESPTREPKMIRTDVVLGGSPEARSLRSAALAQGQRDYAMTADKVKEIRAAMEEVLGPPQQGDTYPAGVKKAAQDLAKKYGISTTTAYNIYNRRSWKWVK